MVDDVIPTNASSVLVRSLMIAMCGVARAQNYVIDQGTSDALTRYLHLNELPMVTAQFSTSPGGSKQLILTGFVATQFGRNDAERIATAYLNDPSVNMVDQILLDPHVEDMRPPPGSAAAAVRNRPTVPINCGTRRCRAFTKTAGRRRLATGRCCRRGIATCGARRGRIALPWPTR